LDIDYSLQEDKFKSLISCVCFKRTMAKEYTFPAGKMQSDTIRVKQAGSKAQGVTLMVIVSL